MKVFTCTRCRYLYVDDSEWNQLLEREDAPVVITSQIYSGSKVLLTLSRVAFECFFPFPLSWLKLVNNAHLHHFLHRFHSHHFLFLSFFRSGRRGSRNARQQCTQSVHLSNSTHEKKIFKSWDVKKNKKSSSGSRSNMSFFITRAHLFLSGGVIFWFIREREEEEKNDDAQLVL